MNGSLDKVQVLVIDCQTTGGKADDHHLVEIGWVAIRAGDVIHGTLPEPDIYLVQQPDDLALPSHIGRLTGITQQQMIDATPPVAVWKALITACQSVKQNNGAAICPTVIHYARFEMAFLKQMHQRFDPGSPFPIDPICTHAIATRLLPGLPRKGLRSVAGYLGHSVPMLKRCLSHLRATAFIWSAFSVHLKKEFGITALADLQGWLRTPHENRSTNRHYPLNRAHRLAAPDKPGVYRFHRSNGDLLYIGKATSLKQRVNSYFQSGRHHSEGTLEMLSQATQLDYEVCRSALEAALHESDEIKRRQPPYNRALTTGERSLVYLSRDMGQFSEHLDEHHRVGPVPLFMPFRALHEVGRWLSGGRLPATLDPAVDLLLGAAHRNDPDRAVAVQGFTLFGQKYSDILDNTDIWQSLIRVARKAWQEKMARQAAEASENGAHQSDPQDDTLPDEMEWTPESIARMLEANVRTCGFLLRRARWLAILSESTLSWSDRDPHRHALRSLVLSQGRVVGATEIDCPSSMPLSPGYHLPPCQRRACLDLMTYDRLRVLTTEVRRILRENRKIYIRLNRRAILGNDQLDRLLWWL